MRHTILLLTGIMMSVFSMYARQSDIGFEEELSPFSNYVTVRLPDYRRIHSGTRICVTYADNVPYPLRNAFDHAARIWEEQLPEALPINVYVSLAHTGTALSSVTCRAREFEGYRVHEFNSPTVMVKSVLMKEYNYGQRHRYYDEIGPAEQFWNIMTPEELLSGTDISIAYNVQLLGLMEFDMEANPDSSKIDFVTLALRDLAAGFGFKAGIQGDSASKRIIFPTNRPTPFEDIVMTALGTTDPVKAYPCATAGTLEISTAPNGMTKDYLLTPYAPSPWKKGLSLATFVPSDVHPITHLMSYRFGPGCMMRDLTCGEGWEDIFTAAQGWYNDILTGPGGGISSNRVEGSTDMTIPYDGGIHWDSSQHLSIPRDIAGAQSVSETVFDRNSNDMCHPYSLFCSRFTVTQTNLGTVGVLMKDGRWDIIFDSEMLPPYIDIPALTLHYPEEEYARSTSGGLRYRVVDG